MILPHELVLATEFTKTKSTRVKEKGIHPKKRPRKPKARAGEIPKVIPRLKKGRVQKMWYHPARLGRTQAKMERKARKIVVRKEKTTETRMAAKQRRFKRDLH